MRTVRSGAAFRTRARTLHSRRVFFPIRLKRLRWLSQLREATVTVEPSVCRIALAIPSYARFTCGNYARTSGEHSITISTGLDPLSRRRAIGTSGILRLYRFPGHFDIAGEHPASEVS